MEKRRLVALTYQAGVSVAHVARVHGVNDNLLFNWRKRMGRTDLAPAPGAGPALNFAVVDVVANAGHREQARGAGLIEIELASGTRLRVDAEVSQGALARVLLALKVVS